MLFTTDFKMQAFVASVDSVLNRCAFFTDVIHAPFVVF